MSRTSWRAVTGAASGWLLATAILCASIPARLAAQDAERGRVLYDRWCAGCHGETGEGDGDAAAYMLPRPRDFTRAVYQVRTTANGELPTDDDLRHVIDQGMPGTAMPGWRTRLTPRERDDVIAHLKSFSHFFEGAQPEAIDFGGAPGRSAEGLAEGARVYRQLECFRCHGDAGRGDGPSGPTLTDDWDAPVRPADLTKPWTFNGGPEVAAIYRRLRTGLDGTPMPSFWNVVGAGDITDEQLWRVAQYVASLGPNRPPVREVIRAVRGDVLPAGPTDSAWLAVEPSYVPLVGQIVLAPRWFTPIVDGLWVRALHDGARLTLLITWNDPSASPDADWQEWLDRLAATVQDADGPLEPVQGADHLAVQFPAARAEGMERPYFLGGDQRRPVYTWRWESQPDRLEAGTATGLARFAAAAAGGVEHAAAYANGEWRLQISRSLVPDDPGAAPTFTVGEAIPIAFQVGDGSSGESGVRGAVSAWYAIYLDVPTPPSVFAMPVVAALLTAGLGAIVVARAQRRPGSE